MICVRLMGGLGNQMFQYAAGRNLSLRHGTNLKLDLGFLLDRTPKKDFVYRDFDLCIFNVQADIAEQGETVAFGKHRKIERILHSAKRKLNSAVPAYVRESPFRFYPRYFKTPANAYLEGYWQSERYFKENEPVIRGDFTFREGLDRHALQMARRIEDSDSVCLNVRRGDFVNIAAASRYHGVCDTDYFLRAVSEIKSIVGKPRFFVFSDDIEWCRTNLPIDPPPTIVDHTYAGARFGQYLQLMSGCRHFIIPNSSFGWWAAWLSRNPGKVVIAPKQWYRDNRMDTRYLTPEEWIRI